MLRCKKRNTHKKTQALHHERFISATPERMLKPDYEHNGKRSYRANTLLSLRKSGKIDSEMESIAEQWLREHIWAFAGYSDREDYSQHSNEFLAGDEITRNLTRARYAERQYQIREIIGEVFYERLCLMLVEGLSFRAIAAQILPNRPITRGAEEISQSCSNILAVLPGAYRTACKIQRDRRNNQIVNRIKSFSENKIKTEFSRVLPSRTLLRG